MSGSMKEAFTKAGYRPARERLVEIAAKALKAYPTDRDARRGQIVSSISHDAPLLWALFNSFASRAIDDLVFEAQRLVQSQRRGAGQTHRDNQTPPDRPTTNTREAAGSGGGQTHCDNQTVAATPAGQNASGHHVSDPQGTPARSPARSGPVSLAVAASYRAAYLKTFFVNGKPIGDVTSREAIAWAGSRERDARFVRLLTANLPPDDPIRKYRTEDEAEKLYRLAEEGNV